jgi:hypothetical protein
MEVLLLFKQRSERLNGHPCLQTSQSSHIIGEILLISNGKTINGIAYFAISMQTTTIVQLRSI